jgi:hypothetical protein
MDNIIFIYMVISPRNMIHINGEPLWQPEFFDTN